MKKILGFIALAAVVALIVAKLWMNKKVINEKNNPVVTATVISVTAEQVKKLPATTSLKKTGVLQAFKEVDISSTAQGKIEEMKFELGTKVSEGQVVAIIDSRIKELTLQQTELTIAKLEKDYNRFQTLLEGDAATEMSVSDIKFNYENAKTQAEQIRKQIKDCRIVSPLSGTVIRRNFDEGEFVNYGTPLGTVVDVSRLKVQVMVSEKEVYGISVDQEVNVTSDIFPGVVLEGKVNYVSPSADPTHSYLVEVTLKNDSKNPVKAGTFVYVEFVGDSAAEVLQIPRNALTESIKNPYVFVIKDSTATKRSIKVGREFGEYLEVLNGLEANEIVVTSGQINLTDNSQVNIISQK